MVGHFDEQGCSQTFTIFSTVCNFSVHFKETLFCVDSVFEKKIFNLGLKSETFYEGFRKCYEEKKKIIYNDDGYIFTPVSSPYLAEGQLHSKRDRVLSKFPDVFLYGIDNTKINARAVFPEPADLQLQFTYY